MVGQFPFQGAAGKLNGLGDFLEFALAILRMWPAAMSRRPQEVRSHQNMCRRVLAPVVQQVVELPQRKLVDFAELPSGSGRDVAIEK